MKLTMIIKKLLFLSLVFLLVLGCATSSGSLLSSVSESKTRTEVSTPSDKEGEEGVEESEETLEEEVEEGIYIYSEPSGAEVYSGLEYLGDTPLFLKVDPGNYRLRIEKSGYYPVSFWVAFESGSTTVNVSLEQIIGYLYLKTTPSDPIARMPVQEIGQGVNVLPVGSYRLTLKRFGYEEQLISFEIYEKATTEIILAMNEAELRIDGVAASRRRFSPENPGTLGTTKITFQVTTWGDGTAEVFSPDGRIVYSETLPRFTDWDQSFIWNGRDSSGNTVEDGDYEIRISAENETQHLKESIIVQVDRSAIISYRSPISGSPGLFFCPLPDLLPEGALQLSVLAFGGTSTSGTDTYLRVPTQFALRFAPVSDLEITAQGTIFINTDEVPWSLGAALSYRYLESPMLSSSVAVKGTYYNGDPNGDNLGNFTDSFTNFTGISLGNPLELDTGVLSFILSPEVIFSPHRVQYGGGTLETGFFVWGYGRGGLLLDFGSLSLGLSAALRTKPFHEGFGIDLPLAWGAEIHWIIPGTQLILSGGITSEVNSSGNFYLLGGGGIGFLN